MPDHVWQAVSPPTLTAPNRWTAHWSEVALFFNLDTSARPVDYAATSIADARNWLDEGADPAHPTISQFTTAYWARLSYGRFGCGLNTPRDTAGAPLVPTVSAPGGRPDDYPGLIRACVNANAEAVWRASGSVTSEGHRYIPSVALIHRYSGNAWATGGWSQTVGGQQYEIGRITHMSYDLAAQDLNGDRVRPFWAHPLAHENGHNFLDFGDLYGPAGCTGYWDLLGDHLAPGHMPEVSSVQKARIGWLTFQVVNGPSVAARAMTLRPYTDTGDAIKVVPDPEHNPLEYFVLEYRRSTGTQPWQPDGGLPEGGLLISHMNERLGIPDTWLLREAAYFDPEFADFSDNGAALWTGLDRVTGILYPQASRNAFTPATSPASDFYGRPSGLSISSIAVTAAHVTFTLAIDAHPQVGWTVGNRDRAVAGRFSPTSRTLGEEVFLRSDGSAALLEHGQAHWFVRRRQDTRIGGWALGANDRELAGDLDGDGLDELYVRSADWAGVLKWVDGAFRSCHGPARLDRRLEPGH